MKVGYYIFLGYGDYHPNITGSKVWVNSWDLNRWRSFIDELTTLDITTLLIYLNGHKLPYKSKLYPELIDINHPNCNNEYLEELLSYIKEKGIELICVITTSGHAGKFSELNPELAIELATPDDSIEATLVSFPKHLRKDKLKKNEGAAQLGYGVLCHNWDYNLDPKRIAELRHRLKKYASFCNKIWFMPSAGFSFDLNISIKEQINAVHKQMAIAEHVGVQGIIQFLGPKSSEFMVGTSRKSLLERFQK